MNVIAKKIGISLLTAATALAPVTIAPAYAGDSDNWLRERTLQQKNSYHHPRHIYRYKKHRGKRHLHRRHRDNTDAIVLGIIGLGVGAAIGGAIANSHSSPRVIQRPAPRVRNTYPAAPRAVRNAGSYEPWTQSWLRYCTQKYRSFNPSTGTYRGYDGRDHFCVVR